MYERDGTTVPLDQIGPILDEPVVPVAHVRAGQAAVVDKLIAVDATLLPGRAIAACGHVRDGILHFAIEVADRTGTNVS